VLFQMCRWLQDTGCGLWGGSPVAVLSVRPRADAPANCRQLAGIRCSDAGRTHRYWFGELRLTAVCLGIENCCRPQKRRATL
jgi:hypothetical protein